MGMERKAAVFGAVGTPTWGALMWGAAGLGWVPPHIAYTLAVIGGGVGVLFTALFGAHIGWTFLRSRGLKLGPAIAIALGLAIVTAGLVWGLLTWQPVAKTENPAPSANNKSFMVVGENAYVEGASITGSTIRGHDSIVEVKGTLKGFQVTNSAIDANASGPSHTSGNIGYFGPPRHWLIPDKLWLAPYEDSFERGAKIGHAIIALRGGFAPPLMNLIIRGSGISSAYLTKHMDKKVLTEAPVKNGVVNLGLENPSGTYSVHIVMTNDPTSSYGVYFSFPGPPTNGQSAHR